jgi:hypothetical protein
MSDPDKRGAIPGVSFAVTLRAATDKPLTRACWQTGSYGALKPPGTIRSFSFWSTVSTVRSISALGRPS